MFYVTVSKPPGMRPTNGRYKVARAPKGMKGQREGVVHAKSRNDISCHEPFWQNVPPAENARSTCPAARHVELVRPRSRPRCPGNECAVVEGWLVVGVGCGCGAVAAVGRVARVGAVEAVCWQEAWRQRYRVVKVQSRTGTPPASSHEVKSLLKAEGQA